MSKSEWLVEECSHEVKCREVADKIADLCSAMALKVASVGNPSRERSAADEAVQAKKELVEVLKKVLN